MKWNPLALCAASVLLGSSATAHRAVPPARDMVRIEVFVYEVVDFGGAERCVWFGDVDDVVSSLELLSGS